MSDQHDFLYKSVTAGDLGEVAANGVIRLIIPWAGYGHDGIALPPKPPLYWSPARDVILRSTVFQDAMWAGAIGIAITKMVSMAFEITSKVPKRQKEMQELLLNADGDGYVSHISKGLRDYLTTDNGQFIEVVRQSKSLSSKIIGLRHLDSYRCTRTGDPETPVIYRDRKGRIHEMKDYQVLMLSDMPDPGETYYGVGLCAASRAYSAIYKLSSMEWYVGEKVAGLHPLAIHIVNGVLDKQLDGAVEAARSAQVSRGATAYMGAVIVGVPSQASPSLVTIPLAELPDRFNRKEEFDIGVLSYANALGLDVQDLQPLSGQSLGSGAQSSVLADKAMGKGLVSWRQAMTHLVNQRLCDDLTEFTFIEKDYRDRKQDLDLQASRAGTSKTRIEAGITTPDQERIILVGEDDLPEEFLAQPSGTEVNPLSDTDQADLQPGVPGAITPPQADQNAGFDAEGGDPFGAPDEAGAPVQQPAQDAAQTQPAQGEETEPEDETEEESSAPLLLNADAARSKPSRERGETSSALGSAMRRELSKRRSKTKKKEQRFAGADDLVMAQELIDQELERAREVISSLLGGDE
jgi:hypothetical protein